MANYVDNISKGRVTEFATRVNANDPAASALYLIPLSATPSQATGEDVDDIAALITAGAAELTTGGWNRKTFADGSITVTTDDTLNRTAVDVADQTWTVVSAGNSVALQSAYASVASPTNAQLTPCTHHDFAITADGSDVTATIADLFRAS